MIDKKKLMGHLAPYVKPDLLAAGHAATIGPVADSLLQLEDDINNLIDRIKVLENAPSEAKSKPEGLECFDVWVVKNSSYRIGIYETSALAFTAQSREQRANPDGSVWVSRRSLITMEQES